jgi:hypothetical protein
MTSQLHGHINVEGLERAWQQAVDLHPVLRSSFIWDGPKEPIQVVHERVRLTLEQHDWRGLPEVEQRHRLDRLLQEDRERGFDLSRAPLMRLVLIRSADETRWFVWSCHHILLDGWSCAQVYKEVLACYEAAGRGVAVELERPRPYRDYVLWLRQHDLSAAESFWRETLNGFTTPTPLPTEPGSAELPDQEAGYGAQEVQLSEETTAALQGVGRRLRLTPNTLVQGAWALLLSRYSGQQDVLFGTVVSGRPHDLDGVESMIGLFINTLPMRIRVSPDVPLMSWLKDVQRQQSEMQRYQFSPLVDIQGWSEVPRGQPLFESIYAFENYPTNEGTREFEKSVNAEMLNAFERTSYPLTVMAGIGHRLSLKLLFDRRRISDAVIARMLEHFKNLLEDIASDPSRPVSALSMVTQAQAVQLVDDFNASLEAF